jgi:hypothetical protein
MIARRAILTFELHHVPDPRVRIELPPSDALSTNPPEQTTAFPEVLKTPTSDDSVPESRGSLYDRGVVQQALNRSTPSNLSVSEKHSVVQGFGTGSSTGIPDSMSFCWSAIVTA